MDNNIKNPSLKKKSEFGKLMSFIWNAPLEMFGVGEGWEADTAIHLKGGHPAQGSNADLEMVDILAAAEVKDVDETPQEKHSESEREDLGWNPENSQGGWSQQGAEKGRRTGKIEREGWCRKHQSEKDFFRRRQQCGRLKGGQTR